MRQIELCVFCHNYQRRLTWFLSSILQQENLNGLKIIPNIASLINNGKPQTELVISHLSNLGLSIKAHWYNENEKEFAYRGMIRNSQVKSLDHNTDWVLFADCDHVYDANFFAELNEHVKNYEDEKAVICVGRYSTDEREKLESIMDEYQYPSLINQPWELFKKIKLRRTSNVGAGNFQLINRKWLEGCYVNFDENKMKDTNLFEKYGGTRSDIQFRKRIGKRIKIDDMKNHQYHMQHKRDMDVGYHLEEQR